jgi:RNA polymerase sigma factor (TIGR02999 family)
MATGDPGEITARLLELRSGGDDARERLFASVYEQLKSLARRQLMLGGRTPTLGATALVHEAYLRLVDPDQVRQWNSRGHFFGAAAEAMRRILVEGARRKQSLKGGGRFQRLELDALQPAAPESGVDLLSLNEALEKLENHDRRKAEQVKLRFFAGLTGEEAARVLGISTTTAENDWAYARSWLRLEMEETKGGTPDEPRS